MTGLSRRLLAPMLLLITACTGTPDSSTANTTAHKPTTSQTATSQLASSQPASSQQPATSQTEAAEPGDCPPTTLTLEPGTDSGFPLIPVLPNDDEALTAGVADMFCSPEWTLALPDATERTITARSVLARDDAACIADRLVRELGAARVRDLMFGAGPWGLLSFGLTNNSGEHHLDRAEAESIVAVFMDCSTHWKLLLILSVTEGADKISDESAACVADRLDDKDAQEILTSDIDRAYDDAAQLDAAPFGDVVAPLVAAYDDCLSADERANLDFN